MGKSQMATISQNPQPFTQIGPQSNTHKHYHKNIIPKLGLQKPLAKYENPQKV